MLSWRKIIHFTSSPAQEYPPLGVTAVKEVPPSSMLNTRSSPSNQADRAVGTWIDIPLHMNPLMRANGGYKGMTAQEALGVANGAGHRPAPALASGPRTGRYSGERK